MDAFSRPRIIDTHFPLTAFDILEMEGSVENTILLDDEEYKRFRHPQLQPLTGPIEPLSGYDLELLKQEIRIILLSFSENCFNKYYCVCILIQKVFKMFPFIIIFADKTSQLSLRQNHFVSLPLILLVGAGFCIFQVHTEKELGQHRKIENQRH